MQKYSDNFYYHVVTNRIGGVMVSMLASSLVYQGFVPRSGQTKDYEIGICCFSAKHAALTWWQVVTDTFGKNGTFMIKQRTFSDKNMA